MSAWKPGYVVQVGPFMRDVLIKRTGEQLNWRGRRAISHLSGGCTTLDIEVPIFTLPIFTLFSAAIPIRFRACILTADCIYPLLLEVSIDYVIAH